MTKFTNFNPSTGLTNDGQIDMTVPPWKGKSSISSTDPLSVSYGTHSNIINQNIVKGSGEYKHDPLKPIFNFEDQVFVLNKTIDLMCYLWATFKYGDDWFIDDGRVYMKAEVYSMVLLKFSK